MIFYLTAGCRNCDEDIFYGPCLTTIETDNGAPVIPFDLAAQTNFKCDDCGTDNYTGDFELFTDEEM